MQCNLCMVTAGNKRGCWRRAPAQRVPMEPHRPHPSAQIRAALLSPDLTTAQEGLRLLEAALDAPTTKDRDGIALAVACVDALVAFVVREDLGREDFHSASLRTCALMAMDRAVLRKMLVDSDTFWLFLSAPRGGLVALVTKEDPSDLTADDAYDLACQMACFGIVWAWFCMFP